MIRFGPVRDFDPSDMGASFRMLVDAAEGIETEEDVQERIPVFTISGERTIVNEDKRKTALLIAYLLWSGTGAAVSDRGRKIVRAFYGPDLFGKPEHPAPDALVKAGATISIEEKEES